MGIILSISILFLTGLHQQLSYQIQQKNFLKQNSRKQKLPAISSYLNLSIRQFLPFPVRHFSNQHI